MCLIAYCKDRSLTDSEFENSFNTNSHGVGFGLEYKGKINYIKGFMNLEDSQKKYNIIKKQLPHIVHFRISTINGIVPELTHPFIVSKNINSNPLSYSGDNSILFHNGIISNYELYKGIIEEISKKEYQKEFKYSDSLIIAKLISYLGENFLKKVSSKFAILSKDKINLYGDFIEDKGIFFSNDSYKDKISYFPTYDYTSYKKYINKYNFNDDDDYLHNDYSEYDKKIIDNKFNDDDSFDIDNSDNDYLTGYNDAVDYCYEIITNHYNKKGKDRKIDLYEILCLLDDEFGKVE